MSGNGRGNMRPASRSPPFLVVGLLIAMCILAINYWSVSSKNKDLLNQLESLQVDFRSVSDKHLAVEKRASGLSSQAAEFQSMVAKLTSSAKEKESKVNTLTDEINSVRGQLQQAQSDSQSHVQEVENEKKSVHEELNRVKTELEDERKKVQVCDKRACSDAVQEVMKVVLDSVGKSKVVAAFSPNHADVLSLMEDTLKDATDPPVQQPQGNPQSQNPDNAQQQQQQQQQQGGQADMDVQGGGQGQMGNMAPQPNVDHDLNAAGQIPTMGQTPDQNQKSNMGQTLQGDQNPNLGVDPNVIQMQQQQQQQQQPGTPSGQEEKYSSQQDLLGVLKPPQNQGLHAGVQGQGGQLKPGEEEKGGKQEIVAQNIPQREGDDAVLSNEHRHPMQDLNGAPAQEDVGDTGHEELPDDEMDKQARANQGAGGSLGSLDDMRDQPQDLSRNQVVDPRLSRHMVGDIDKMDVDTDQVKADERRAERRDFDDRDEGTLEENHKEHTGTDLEDDHPPEDPSFQGTDSQLVSTSPYPKQLDEKEDSPIPADTEMPEKEDESYQDDEDLTTLSTTALEGGDYAESFPPTDSVILTTDGKKEEDPEEYQ